MLKHTNRATKLYKDTLPFKSESFDILVHKEEKTSIKIKQSIDKYNSRLEAIERDLTMNEHSKHLAKSKALESLNVDLDSKIGEFEDAMSHKLSVAKEGLFSSNVALDAKQIQLLNSHLQAFKDGKHDISNPIQASVLVELSHQGLISRDVIAQIDLTYSPSQVEMVSNASDSRDKLMSFKSDLNNYNKSFDHQGAERIKASQYSAQEASDV